MHFVMGFSVLHNLIIIRIRADIASAFYTLTRFVPSWLTHHPSTGPHHHPFPLLFWHFSRLLPTAFRVHSPQNTGILYTDASCQLCRAQNDRVAGVIATPSICIDSIISFRNSKWQQSLLLHRPPLSLLPLLLTVSMHRTIALRMELNNSIETLFLRF